MTSAPTNSAYAWITALPAGLRWALLASALWQLASYFSLASPRLRARWTPARLAASALVPWLVYTLAAGLFSPLALLILLSLIASAAWWFEVLPRSRWTDFGYIVWMALPILLRWFVALFPAPAARVPTETLGHVMWIQVGLATVLNSRRMDFDFGFWPGRRQWRTGALWFAVALPAVAAAALSLGLVHFVVPPTPVKYIAGAATFFGILWVVALSEECFFRALLQGWLEEWSGSAAVALAVASLTFGAAHLGYRQFPNWQMAVVATLLGAACGMAYRQAGVRASMVTHALLVTVWKTFFR
jgi:membrane protease YdiL (CAAX protease family)